MQRRSARMPAVLLAVLLAVVLGSGLAVSAAANPTPPPVTGRGAGDPLAKQAPTDETQAVDDLPNPLEANRRALRDEALQQVLSGDRKPVMRNGSRVVKMGTKEIPVGGGPAGRARQRPSARTRTVDSYVELSREQTDKIFVILVEFGDQRDPRYPDTDTDPQTPGPVTFDGPLHNTIPAPDRTRDNTTIWRPDFGRDYYRDLYFSAGEESLKGYYERQSSGRYSVAGDVTDWVKVPYNQARYGRSNGNPCPQNVCSNTWFLVRDAVDQWMAGQKAAGRTIDEIRDSLASYDVWDRYDGDGDGIFNEPDGYLDHFQIVHAGGDQSDGDRVYGEDAIWSHRWRAFPDGEPETVPPAAPVAGVNIGETGLYVADYTIQAENAGLSVFAHEYGHDLGLPDHYDTTARTDNAMNWWSLMDQSRLKAKGDVGVGTRPADLGVWDKLQLGWLDFGEVISAGDSRTIELGPHAYNSSKPQGLVVELPPKTVVTPLPTPATGRRQWWSGDRDNANTGLFRRMALVAGEARLTFAAQYNIEDCGTDPCDAAYVEVDDLSDTFGFQAIRGSITTGEQNVIVGQSAGWVPATFDLTAFAGKPIELRFRYATNACGQGKDPSAPAGLLLDDITITSNGQVISADGAENGLGEWQAIGFRDVATSESASYSRYYLASYRSYVSYDQYLQTGPYNLGWPLTRPQKAEFFPYQDGLLVNLWDTQYADNNTSCHPGSGRILPIDANPAPLRNADGDPWRGRIQTYDAPFSLQRSDSFVLHNDDQLSFVRGRPAQPLFDDTRSYWTSELPNVGVKVPGVGVTLQVLAQSRTSLTVQVGRSQTKAGPATAVR